MEDFYKELLTRRDYLKTKPSTKVREGQIYELQLVIVRVQQILLSKL